MSTNTPVEIYLNSKYASYNVNGTSNNSDMIFYFRSPIIPPLGYSTKIRVSNFVFPLSFTLVNGNNNRLVINGITYTLTQGNYNANSLRTHILSLIPSTFTMTFSSVTNKYTINNNTNFTINSTSTCLVLLGFTQQNHTSVANSLTSNAVVNLSGDNNVIYIDLANVPTLNISSTNSQRTSVIKSIPVSVATGSIMYWENGTDSYVLTQTDNISFFHIRILGEDLVTPVQFNSQHWNMTLECSFIPKENPTEDTTKDFAEVYNKYITKFIPTQQV